MARVFNISFQHKDKSYTALVSVSGKQEEAPIQVISNNDNIHILLPTGRLTFAVEKGSKNTTVYITDSISMQLLNTDW
jgi:hypothetical protein